MTEQHDQKNNQDQRNQQRDNLASIKDLSVSFMTDAWM